MNPNHPDNPGKWIAFNALGYDVIIPENRNLAAQDIIRQLHQNWNAPFMVIDLKRGLELKD